MYRESRQDATFRWDMTPDFKRDIHAMWEICRQNARLWNTQLCVFEAAERLTGAADALTVRVPTEQLREEVERSGGKFRFFWQIINGLTDAGLLCDFDSDDEMTCVTYKNEQVKRCLTVAGRALEMKVFLAALEATENDGTKTYNDVMNGVCIDWDGDVRADRDGYDTENEIDVLMMHGMVPVFVSCKNGYVDKDELYKLHAVATRFGGKYAKKVLVATSLGDSDFSNYLRQRAEDMGIRLIEGYSHDGNDKAFTDLNDDEINRIVRSLWLN